MNHNIHKIAGVLLVAVVLAIVAMWFVRTDHGPVETGERDTPAAQPLAAGPVVDVPAQTAAESEHDITEPIAEPGSSSPEDPEPESQGLPEIARNEEEGRHGDPPTDAEIVEGVRDSIDGFIAAGLTGDVEAARTFSKPGTVIAEQSPSIQEVRSEFPDLPLDVYGGGKHALAVSWRVEVQEPSGLENGYLLFTLEQDESGTWLIGDIDFENQDNAELEIDKFIETYEAELLTPDRK